MIVVVGFSHRESQVELRERYAVPVDEQGPFLQSLRQQLGGGVALLSTCNRVELYAEVPNGVEPAALGDALVKALEARVPHAPGGDELADVVFRHDGQHAVRHAYRVASSLESMVVGEPQILGQFKEAYMRAESAGTLGPVLGRALRSALAAAKRVRSETQIGEGQVSISSVAVDLARGIVGELKERKVLCVGAGTMAEAALRAMHHEGARLTICNRGAEQRDALAEAFGGTAVALSELEGEMLAADVVIVSTGSPDYVVSYELAERVMKKRRGRTLFVIDIAVPRNVDPRVHALDDVYVYNVDDLERRVGDGAVRREGAVRDAERLLDEELSNWGAWVRELGAKDAVVRLRTRVDEVLKAELERSLAGKLKGLGPAERDAMRAMVDAMTAKITHGPITTLKAMAPEEQAHAAAVLSALFGLQAAPDSAREEAS